MTNISLETRKLLKNKFVINHINIDRFQKSNDGTIKNAIALFENFPKCNDIFTSLNRMCRLFSLMLGLVNTRQMPIPHSGFHKPTP